MQSEVTSRAFKLGKPYPVCGNETVLAEIEPARCIAISGFTDMFVNDADPSNHWPYFARHDVN
jgi:hypothetical protein